MSVSIDLQSRTSQYPAQVLTVHDATDSVNYDALAEQLGIASDDTVKAVVMNSEGVAVLLEPKSVKSGEKYWFVVEAKTDAEIDGTSEKWSKAQLEEAAEELRMNYATAGKKELNAAMNGYMGDTHNQPEHVTFPDMNANIRAAYAAGLASQIPKELTIQSSDSNTVGGGSFEPTVGALVNTKMEFLRWAYGLGLQNDDKKAKDFLPSDDELRDAYKQGKEAVCISISAQSWGSVNKETFKLCSVPVAYAEYEGGQDKHLHELLNYRAALRKMFLLGVDDAWNARENGTVTAVTAQQRVPDSPDLRTAFTAGTSSAKQVGQPAPGCTTVLAENFEVVVTGETSEVHKSTKHAFEQGLKEAWLSYSGGEATKPEVKYPDTSAAERAAFKAGSTAKHAEEKRKEALAKAAERDAAEQEVEEKPSFFMVVYGACCPACTTAADGTNLCCGASYGDWTIILLLFAFYYVYLGMWMWSLLEIMMTVAEPQRPW